MSKRVEINEADILTIMEEMGIGSIQARNVVLAVKLHRPSHTFRIVSSEHFYDAEGYVHFRRFEVESAAPCHCHNYPAL